MKVVIDQAIPYIKGVLEPFADEVRYLRGNEFSFADVRDADALIIRTRTKCNASLLEHKDACGNLEYSKVSFIASATIGEDHVDKDYLERRHISFANAPGCNAGGVMQYVLTALYTVAERKGISLSGKTMGVIGVGNTGSRVAALAEHLGFRVLRNDPPKALKEKGDYYPLDYVLEHSDIITCHLPLDSVTRGMVNAGFLSRMKDGAIFINASRGEVVVDDALISKARTGLSALILDVWNGEPSSISRELLSLCDIATPHIAGYSYEGKVNGTVAVVRAFGKHFGIPELASYEFSYEKPAPFLDFSGLSQNEAFSRMYSVFPIMELDAILRADPASFETIRSTYVCRNEFRY